jgi:heptosyltransferase-2
MNKILIIQTASIGDVILATALVESLHRSFPEAEIDFMVKKGNESLFTGHPYLRKVIVWDKRSGKFGSLIRILKEVRQIRYDLTVNIQRFFLTGLLTVLSGSRETRGFSKNPLSLFYTHRFKHVIGTGLHEVNRNHVLISNMVPAENLFPRLYPAAADEAMVHPYTSGLYYTISPASLWFTKQYPVKKWVELIRQIPVTAQIYLLGAPVDQPLCEEILTQSGHPGTIILAGKLTFLQSAALMKNAKMNFTNDSAPMHLASAVNAPVTALYCSTVPEFGFGPLSDISRIIEITEKLSCRPCGLHGFPSCPEKHFKCAFGIDIAQLKEVI